MERGTPGPIRTTGLTFSLGPVGPPGARRGPDRAAAIGAVTLLVAAILLVKPWGDAPAPGQGANATTPTPPASSVAASPPASLEIVGNASTLVQLTSADWAAVDRELAGLDRFGVVVVRRGPAGLTLAALVVAPTLRNTPSRWAEIADASGVHWGTVMRARGGGTVVLAEGPEAVVALGITAPRASGELEIEAWRLRPGLEPWRAGLRQPVGVGSAMLWLAPLGHDGPWVETGRGLKDSLSPRAWAPGVYRFEVRSATRVVRFFVVLRAG